MEATYTTSEEDFVRAGLLLLRKRPSILGYLPQWGIMLAMIVLGLAAGIVGARLLLDHGSHDWIGMASVLREVSPGLLVAALMLSTPVWTRLHFSRWYRKYPSLTERKTLVAGNAGLEFSSASESARTAWPVYRRFWEDQHNFLLVRRGGPIFVSVPKRELSAAQVEELRSLFQQYLASR